MISEVIIEVCEYFAEGNSINEIALKMHMSEDFVKEILELHYEEFMDGGEKYETKGDNDLR